MFRFAGILRRQLARFLQGFAQIDSRIESIIVEGRGAEVSVACGKTVLQFVGIGGDYPLFIQLAAAIFEAPLDKRPELLGLRTVAPRQGVTSCAVGNHGGITTVAGTVPDVRSLGNDGAGNRLIRIVHETGEVLVGVEGRAVPLVVAEEGEEGVDVLRLVVGPNRGVVGFPARAVH